MREAGNLKGRVVLVAGADVGAGAAIALALAARGANVLVTGRNERRLGEIVGEIAYGGGKARHLAVDPRDDARFDASVRRALDVWGALDVVLANDDLSEKESTNGLAWLRQSLLETSATFEVAAKSLREGGGLFATSAALVDRREEASPAQAAAFSGLRATCEAYARALAPRGIACKAVVRDASFDVERDEQALVDVVVSLITDKAPSIATSLLSVG